MKKKKNHIVKLLPNLIVVLLLFALPYYLFEGRFFLGGDDTRFYYAYPLELLRDLAIHPWINISSLPLYLPNHHSIPLLAFFSMLDFIINSKIHLFYFAFSLPMVLGYIYFQKFIREILGGKEYLIPIIGALIYVLSPITLVSQISHFLNPVWLVALFPIISYYYLCYIRRGIKADVIKAVGWSFLLSIAYYSSPWIFALVISFICGSIYLFFTNKHMLGKIFKKTLIFWSLIIASQLFWAFPFIMSLLYIGESDLTGKIASDGLTGSFLPTVNATATGNIIYPLMTFYHRAIAFDFEWQLSNVFTSYYDYVLPLSLIFVLVAYLGIANYKKVLSRDNKKVFIFLFISFIVALYLFTVNIGFLKLLFHMLGYLPGFAVFRNFTDKFALSYIFIYASFLSFCLFVIKNSYKRYLWLVGFMVVVIIINAIPIKQIVNSPLWKTDDIYRNSHFPTEYTSFIKEVEETIPTTSNVFALPQNIAAYSIITEDNRKNAYIGTSPFKFFTGVNDLSGNGSYPKEVMDKIRTLIMSRRYDDLLLLLTSLNTGYIMATNNIPEQVKDSYIYEEEYLSYQDSILIEAVVDKELIRSKNGNYILYKLKNSPTLFSSNANTTYEKVSPTEYRISIDSSGKPEFLIFHETFHPGWKIYHSNFGVLDKLAFLKPGLFERSHKAASGYGNIWILDFEELKKNGFEGYSQKNGYLTFTIYFFPQSYLYIGAFMTMLGLALGGLYLFRIYEKRK